MPKPLWEFAIDVGGTFTDCLAQAPDGRLLQHKLLSSGVTKGTVGKNSTADLLVDPSRQNDPPNFWVGYHLALLDRAGKSVAATTVVDFDHKTGSLQLAENLPVVPSTGTTYELTCDLEAPVIGIRYLLGLPLSQPVPKVTLRLGTTRGTNALLTRTGAKTALVTTGGFADLLKIGYQDRLKLFELTIRKPPQLVDAAIEVEERVSADGEVLIPLDEADVLQQLKQLREQGIESLAICLLHADRYPAHEQRVAAIASALGFPEISCSHQVSPLIKIVPRAETTVVDAYLNPVLRKYLSKLQGSLPASSLRLMTSAGGLVSANAFRGHESVLSGPAGGVVGYAQAAATVGFQRAIGFDMGGTSTDVSRYDGQYEYEYETHKAGVRLVAPTLAIETVAAGGGSICHFDGSKLTVGPDSAGADPGPACYGRGGPLTVTDLNFYLGRIATERFPFALDYDAVQRQLQQLSETVKNATGQQLSPTQLAAGLLQVANASMVRAIRGITVAKGANPSDYALVAFGGAGAQHACAVARELSIKKILYHPHAGILSAYGIGQADVTRHAATGIGRPLHDVNETQLEGVFKKIEKQSAEQLLAEGFTHDQIEVKRSLDLRYQGTDATLNIPFHSLAGLSQQFPTLHQKQYGYTSDKPIEAVAARLQVIGKADRPVINSISCPPQTVAPIRVSSAHFDGQSVDTPIYDRATLQPGASISGPAIIADNHSTIVVEPHWQAELLSGGELILTDHATSKLATATNNTSDVVMLEIFNNLLAGVAELMGHVLRRTASSVNVKERLDYSCAVFTAQGELVANAPHVPVHLGAMGTCVRAVLAEYPNLTPGDVFVTNDPYRGGSHLPDITVVTPVHHSETNELLFFTASRAHHAEIGGVRPGSMPPFSTKLSEEGVLITNFALIREGVSYEDRLRDLLTSPPYPSRRVDENMADLRAQVAANRQGANNLRELVDRYTLPVVQAQVQAVQQAAESKVRQALSDLQLQTGAFADHLETPDGRSIPIQVQLTFHAEPSRPALTIDFTGTASVVAGNLNANPSIVTAAVLYVLRLLLEEEVPLNEGALRAIEIILPTGLLNPTPGDDADSTPAVAAGNVETSQRVVDVLLGALGIAAASQGTMNNLLFGNENFGYYETIAGGSGATADGPGADAVQVHMTNTRSTDPEVLERRLPVRLWEFSIRHHSGGAGQHPGGNGVVRRLEFLEPLEVSLITQRRGPHPPYGLAGGSPGSLGSNELIRADQPPEQLPGTCEFNVNTGDRLNIQTPGGGGYGVVRKR